MGFFDFFTGADDLIGDELSEEGTLSSDEDEPGLGIGFGPEFAEGIVDVEKRADIIDEEYDDVSEEEAKRFADLLKTQIEESGLRRYEAHRQLDEEMSLDRDRIETIWWNERFSAHNLESLYPEESTLDDLEFSWLTPDDDDVHPICESIVEEIEERGGSVPPDDLVSIIREKAEEHEDGHPHRAEHLVPHDRCRGGVQAIVDDPFEE